MITGWNGKLRTIFVTLPVMSFKRLWFQVITGNTSPNKFRPINIRENRCFAILKTWLA